MERKFHLFVRRCGTTGYSASVLTHPWLASFAADVDDARADVARVAGRLLARDLMRLGDEVAYWSSLKMRRVNLVVRAVH